MFFNTKFMNFLEMPMCGFTLARITCRIYAHDSSCISAAGGLAIERYTPVRTSSRKSLGSFLSG